MRAHKAGRIRRSTTPPWTNVEIQEWRRQCKVTLATRHNYAGATVRYGKSKWSWLANEKGIVKQRKIRVLVEAGKRTVGLLEIVENDVYSFSTNEDIYYVMDAETSIDGEAAIALCQGWLDIDAEVASYGNIVDFRCAWMEPEYAKNGMFSKVFEAIIEKECQKYALIILKAFPLEYQCRVDNAQVERHLNRRIKAMFRHYEKLLDVQAFPGKAGERGWMCRINPMFANVIEFPQTNPCGITIYPDGL